MLQLGHIVCPPGVMELMERYAPEIINCLTRHRSGDWGDVCEEDRKENDQSADLGYRVLSAYTIDQTKIWIITEANRSSTCVLLPDEY